jgi:flagellar motility protein MotE (MotC chaperone)
MIILLFITLVIKIADVIEGSDSYSDMFLVSNLSAEDKASPPQGGDKKSDDATDPVSTKRPLEFDCHKQQFNDIELEILQSLAKRRKEIEDWSDDVKTKEALLKAAQMKVDSRLDELKTLKDEVDKLLVAYNQKEDMKINSLVKIYETMKPKDAARIFEGLEMDILLQVIDRMKQSKTAPILAQMDPVKATELTTEFANQKKLPTP